MIEDIELQCKIHFEKIVLGQRLQNGEVKMCCQSCLRLQNFIPIEELYQDVGNIARKKIDKFMRAQSDKIQQFAKMKKIYFNLKINLLEKIDIIIKVIEEGEKSLQNKYRIQFEYLDAAMKNPSNSFIQNLFEEEERSRYSILFETENKKIIDQITDLTQQLIAIINLVTQQGILINSQSFSFQDANLQQLEQSQSEAPEYPPHASIQSNTSSLVPKIESLQQQSSQSEQSQQKPSQDSETPYRRLSSLSSSSKIKIIWNQTFQEEKKKQYKYEMISSLKIDQCEGFGIGMNDQYFINGNCANLQLWKFDDGSMTYINELKGKTIQVWCLCFSKKSNWFISGFYDGQLQIWQQQENDNWNCIQTLTAHKTYIKCLILTQQEDQFFSFSDKQIIVWMRNILNCQWQSVQTLGEFDNVLFSSLNPNNKLLASIDYTKKIFIWERGNQWSEKQVVLHPTNDKYIRICFIEDNELIATTEMSGKLVQFYLQNEEFQVLTEFPLNTTIKELNYGVFPIVYNGQLKVAIVRHNNTVYIVTKNNGEFVINSTIQGNYWLNELSQNGQYLFMWCKDDKKLQVWKLS